MPITRLEDIGLYYETAGSGTPAVLVNSWGTTLRIWDQVVIDLMRDHHVVSYDWRGCGRSDRTAEGNTIAQNAVDLLALIDRLGLDRPVLVGCSVGALFACEAARSAGSDRVAGVVVLDGPGHWAVQAAEQLRAHRRALAADRAATVAASVANMYTGNASDELRAWTVRQILDASPHIDVLFDEQATYDPRSWLAELEVPVHYVHGRHDKAVPLHVPEELAALAGGTVVAVDGAGHLAQQERPAEVAAAVREFTGRTRGTGGGTDLSRRSRPAP